MSFNLRQIEVFRAVMITGSIRGASQLLFVSQPAVSQLLSHTEARVGFPLFERIRGRLFATPEAKKLFHEVELVYAGVKRVNELARELHDHQEGILNLTLGGLWNASWSVLQPGGESWRLLSYNNVAV